MNQGNKYYIPNIEEFYIGFECEIEHITSAGSTTEYKKHIISENDNIKDLYESNDWYNTPRVKYLDQQDIESLGFTIETTSYGMQYKKNKTFIKFSYDKKLIIEKYFIDIGINSVVFIGDIKNKSELKKLLKQLAIE